MTRNDDDHKVARIIKGLEERIANLEEKDRSSSIPTLLRTKTDQVTVSDPTPTVTEKQLQLARWRDYSSSTGYQNEGYGEGGYAGVTFPSNTNTESDPTAGFGEGGYGEGVFGTGGDGPSGVATTAWHTGLWGSYEVTQR